MSFRNCFDNKDCSALREHLPWRLEEWVYAIRHNTQVFDDPMEMLNFLILDMLTQWFHGLPDNHEMKLRYIDNLKQIVSGLERSIHNDKT